MAESGEVLVVGAGPVGLALACELTRHGVACRIVDQAPGPTDQSRALGLQARTLEVFEVMGVIDAVLARGRRVHGMAAFSDKQALVRLTFDFEGLDTPYPFVMVLPQGETERILIDHLAGLGVAVERRVRLTGLAPRDDGVLAMLEDAEGRAQQFETPWLVGCDGAHSAVRHALGLPFEGAPYPESFLLADVRIDWDLPGDEMAMFIRPEGVAVAFPLPEAGRWRLVDTSGGLESDDPARVADWFQAILRAQGPGEAVVSEPTWVAPFRVHRRMVPEMRAGRCFLAGDASHIHSPAGGQGLNTGIQDAYNLAWKLALVIAGAAREDLLDSYSAERHPVAESVLRGSDRLTKAVTLRNPVSEQIRNHLMGVLGQFDFVRRLAARDLSELGVGYRHSPIVAEDRSSILRSLVPIGRPEHAPGPVEALDFARGPHPGDRVPDVALADPNGSGPSRLFEVLRGTRNVLLLFEGLDPDEPSDRDLVPIARGAAARLGDRLTAYFVLHRPAPPVDLGWDGPALLDPDAALHHRFGAGSECLYLIRPDGYVGYRAQPADGERLERYLDRIFITR